MHLGARTPRGVYTVLKEGGKSRAKIEEAIGPAATQTALRLRRQIGYTAAATSACTCATASASWARSTR